MRSKMNFAFLGAFVLFTVVYSQEPSSDELKKLTPCYEYILCKDPELLKEFYSCNDALSTKDFQKYYQYLKKNFFPFKSANLSGAVMEYCSYNEAKEKDVFDKVIHADFSFQKKSGADGEESIESGLEEITNCVYKILEKANSQGKCTTL